MPLAGKDLYLKEKAIRFCLANELVPFLEVKISNRTDVMDTPHVLTDLDVVGVGFDSAGGMRRTLFDCKTIKSSPINRAFWAAGVLSYTGCDEAFVLLEREAPESHRLSARFVNVHLFNVALFDRYAEAADLRYRAPTSYLSKIGGWREFEAMKEDQQPFSEILLYCNNVVPIQRDYAKSLRRVLQLSRSVSGELDPSKNAHMGVFCEIVGLIVMLLAHIVGDLRNLFDPAYDRDKFEEMLRYYIWGGRESYLLAIHEDQVWLARGGG